MFAGRLFVALSGKQNPTVRDFVHFSGRGTIGEFPNLTAAMEKAGWPESKIRKVMGENWMRVLKEVWGA